MIPEKKRVECLENVKNKALFESVPVPKAVLTMAVPTVIGQLIVLIYNMADTYFIGKTNNPMMVAGASLILPVFNISLSIASLAGVGGGALISRLLGVGCALVSIALYETFAPDIVRIFIKDAATVGYGKNFLRIRCVATLFMFLSFYHVHLFNGYGRGMEATGLALIRWVGLNIPLMILLNRLLGIYGIAWTQLIADAINVAISVVIHRSYLRRHLQTQSIQPPAEK